MNDLVAYRALCAAKKPKALDAGIRYDPELNGTLFLHQEHGVRFALRAGRSALFYDTGLGKTMMMLEWGRVIVEHENKPVLMLCPLAVAAQHLREAEHLGVEASISRFGGLPASPQIVITNYERLHHFNPADFAGVILDECFAPDTNIDVLDQFGNRYKKHIENVQIGDRIWNAAGVDLVSDVHRREVPYAVRVSYAGQSIIASPNHPFFTLRGWVGAQDLRPGDEVVATAEAVRILRQDVSGSLRSGRQDEILRSILLSEMADAPARALGQGAHAGSSRKARKSKGGVSGQRRSARQGRDRSYNRSQSNDATGGAGQSLTPIERDRAQTFRAWGQRTWFDDAAGGFDGCAARQLEGGICFVVGVANSRLSDALQNRLSQHRKTNSYRSGWLLAQQSQGSGPKERSQARSLRVDGVEILEPGNPALDCYRDAEGKLYFYDLGGTRHPSFSINGGLVHNSSILKSFTGVTTQKLIEAFAATPFRLAGTATPAPNDHTELGQHSEFLGVMRREEMLVRWFLHDSYDTKDWRLKRHAVQPFWDWVASWARCVSKPSDLGFSDDGFVLPPLKIERHIVSADRTIDAGEEGKGKHEGQMRLFRIPDRSATAIHKEKRLTIADRAAEVAAIVAANPNEPICIWVDTDYEANAIKALGIEGLKEVRGSMPIDRKEETLDAFSRGELRIMLTKPSIAGFGLNWQHCSTTIFAGVSFSYESFYQAVRRFWRFGQKRPVTAHIVCADTELEIASVVTRKSEDHERMKREMAAAMARAAHAHEILDPYQPGANGHFPSWLGG